MGMDYDRILHWEGLERSCAVGRIAVSVLSKGSWSLEKRLPETLLPDGHRSGLEFAGLRTMHNAGAVRVL